MPTYEYKREDGTTFEITQGINDDALEKCPETGQKVKRVISGGGGVVYKGDGFYITDYKRKDEKKSNRSSDGNGSADSSSSSSNGASKTESKTETTGTKSAD